jgi:hypothetical protein
MPISQLHRLRLPDSIAKNLIELAGKIQKLRLRGRIIFAKNLELRAASSCGAKASSDSS